jgi:tetratricopeptide (TPR) repeat protein
MDPSLIDALDLLRQAIARDADFASALALAAYCHASLDGIGRVADRDANRQKALDLAHRALRVAGDDALALAATAHVLGYFNEDIHAAIAIIDRSLALNPSLAYGWRWSGFARLYAGNPELAIEHFERSIRLNPRDLRWAQLTGIGIAHRLLDDSRAPRCVRKRSTSAILRRFYRTRIDSRFWRQTGAIRHQSGLSTFSAVGHSRRERSFGHSAKSLRDRPLTRDILQALQPPTSSRSTTRSVDRVPSA